MALEMEPSQWGTDNVFDESSISPSYSSRRSKLGSSNLEVFIEEEHLDGGALTTSGPGVLTVSTATASSGSATSPEHISNGNGAVSMRRGNSQSAINLNWGYMVKLLVSYSNTQMWSISWKDIAKDVWSNLI